MKRLHRSVLAFLCATTMLFSLTACGSTPSTVGSQDDQEQTAEIYLYCESSEVLEGLQKTADLYHELNPNVTVVVETNAESYSESLKAKFAGGEEPDIFGLHGYSDASLYSEYLADLSNEPWVPDMAEITVDNITVDGKILGMPMSVEGLGYVYNADLFAEAGITEVPSTLSEFKTACEKLAAIGVSPISETYMDSFQGGYFFCDVAIAQQEDPMAFMEGLSNGTSKVVGNAAFENLADLLVYDYSQCINPMNTDYNSRIALLANGEAAITCGGNWIQPSFTQVDPDLNFKMMGVPLADDKDYDVIGVSCAQYWGVNANSEHVQECKDFLNWLATDPQGQECLTKNIQLIPGFTTIEADESVMGSLGMSVSEYLKAGKTVGRYSSYFPDGVADKWGEEVQKLVAGQCTKDEFLLALQEDWYDLAG